MAYLIDTNTIIYSLKNDGHVTSRFVETENMPKSISVITYGELVYGAKNHHSIGDPACSQKQDSAFN